MTEPTAKLNAESNGQQETITTAKKESNVDKNTAVENPHVGKEAPKNEPVDTPDKAALLTMFTLSDIEAVATEAVISESSDSLTVAANLWRKKPMSLRSVLRFIVFSMSVLDCYIWHLPIRVLLT